MAVSKTSVKSAPTGNTNVKYGETLTLTAGEVLNQTEVSDGKTQVRYQWQFKAKGTTTFTNLGADSDLGKLNIREMDLTKEGSYRVGTKEIWAIEPDETELELPTDFNFVDGTDVEVAVIFDDITVAVEQDDVHAHGSVATLTGTVTGNPAGTELEYKWESKTGKQRSFKVDNNQTTKDYTIAELNTANEGAYRLSARIKTPDNRLQWKAAEEINVAITKFTVSAETYSGQGEIEYDTGAEITSTITVDNLPDDAELEYQWQFKAEGADIWTPCTEQPEGASYVITNFDKAQVGAYRTAVRVVPTGHAKEKERPEWIAKEDGEGAVCTIQYSEPTVTLTANTRGNNGEVGHNAPITLTAVASEAPRGETLEYVWEKDGTVVEDATGLTHQIAQFKNADVGSYVCKARIKHPENKYEYGSSDACALKVKQPVLDVSVTAPSEKVSRKATGKITAITTEAPDGFKKVHKWQFKAKGASDWTDLDTVAHQHVISDFAAEHEGEYRAAALLIAVDAVEEGKEEDQFEFGSDIQVLEVKRGTVSVTSGNDTSALTVEYNGQATLTANVVVTEAEEYTIQWQRRDTTDTTKWNDIKDANQAIYTHPVKSLDDEGVFRCLVTPTDTTLQPVQTGEVTVSLMRSVITLTRSDQADQYVKHHDAISLGVTGTVDHQGETITYQWQKQNASGAWEAILDADEGITGQDSQRLAIKDCVPDTDGKYRVEARTNNPATPVAHSDEYTVKVVPASVSISIGEEEEIFAEGKNEKENKPGSTITLAATSKTDIEGEVEYQWQISNHNETGFVDLVENNRVTGVRSPNLKIENVEEADEKYYRVLAKTKYVETQSHSAAVLISVENNPEPVLSNLVIAHQSGSQGKTHIGAHHAIEGTVTTNLSDVVYHWEFKPAGQETYVALKGRTEGRLLLENVTKQNAGTYRLVAKGNRVKDTYLLKVESNELELIVNKAPTVEFSTPVNLVERQAEEKDVNLVTTYAVDSGTVATVKWTKDGEAFTPDAALGQSLSADNTVLSFATLREEDRGQYRLQVSLDETAAPYLGAIIDLRVTPSLRSKFLDVTRSSAETLVIDEKNPLTIGVTATNSYLYEWYKNDIKLEGVATALLTYQESEPADTATYKLRVIRPENSAEFIEFIFSVTVNAAEHNDVVVPTTSDIEVVLDRTNLGIIRENDAVVIHAVINGTVEGIQWYHVKEGRHLPIVGQTTETLSVTFGAELGHTLYLKAKYRKEGEADFTDVVSEGIVVSEFIPVTPSLDLDLANRSVHEGDTVTMTATVSPDDSFVKYRWVHIDAYGAEKDVPDANTATLTLAPVLKSDEGNYCVYVTRLGRTVKSGTINLSVAEMEVLKEFTVTFDQNGHITRPQGTVFTLEATATNTTPNTVFTWYRKVGSTVTQISQGTLAENHAHPTLVLNDLTEGHIGHYYLEVKEGISFYRSPSVHLNVVPMSSITTPNGDNMTEETQTDGATPAETQIETPDAQFRTLVKKNIDLYEEKMRVGKPISPEVGIGAQIHLMRDLRHIILLEDLDEFHAKMDAAVDQFYKYRNGVFKLEYRFRFLSSVTKEQLSPAELDGFREIIIAFCSMASPGDEAAMDLTKMQHLIPDSVGPAKKTMLANRFELYYQRKMEAGLDATEEPSVDPLAP